MIPRGGVGRGCGSRTQPRGGLHWHSCQCKGFPSWSYSYHLPENVSLVTCNHWSAVMALATYADVTENWKNALKAMLKVAEIRVDGLLLERRVNSPCSAQLLRRSSYSGCCCRMRNTNPIRPSLPSLHSFIICYKGAFQCRKKCIEKIILVLNYFFPLKKSKYFSLCSGEFLLFLDKADLRPFQFSWLRP